MKQEIELLDGRCAHADSELEQLRHVLAEKDQHCAGEVQSLELKLQQAGIRIRDLEDQGHTAQLEHTAFVTGLEQRHTDQMAAERQAHMLEMERQLHSLEQQQRVMLSESEAVHNSRLQTIEQQARQTAAESEGARQAELAAVQKKSFEDARSTTMKESQWRDRARASARCARQIRDDAISKMRQEQHSVRMAAVAAIEGMQTYLKAMQNQLAPAVTMLSRQVKDAQAHTQELQKALATVLDAVHAEAPLAAGTHTAVMSGGASSLANGASMIRGAVRAAVISAGAEQHLHSLKQHVPTLPKLGSPPSAASIPTATSSLPTFSPQPFAVREPSASASGSTSALSPISHQLATSEKLLQSLRPWDKTDSPGAAPFRVPSPVPSGLHTADLASPVKVPLMQHAHGKEAHSSKSSTAVAAPKDAGESKLIAKGGALEDRLNLLESRLKSRRSKPS